LEPDGLWIFDDSLADSGSGGNDAAVEAGTSRFVSALGKRWFYADGSTNLLCDGGSFLGTTGDVSIFMQVLLLHQSSHTAYWVSHGNAGAGEDINWNYIVRQSNTALNSTQEYGASGFFSSETFSQILVTAFGVTPVTYGCVRSVTDLETRHYFFGENREVDTFSAGEVPTGGENGQFRLFGDGAGVFALPMLARNIFVKLEDIGDEGMRELNNEAFGVTA